MIYDKVFKQILDFLLRLITLPFVLMDSLFSPIAIIMDDSFPIFYDALHIGKKKNYARHLQTHDGSTYNASDDSRRIRMGKLLPKALPQVRNVLLGQMYRIDAQTYFRNSIQTREKYQNDIYYVDHVSFGLGVKIFFKTVFAVLKSEAIYTWETVVSTRILIDRTEAAT